MKPIKTVNEQIAHKHFLSIFCDPGETESEAFARRLRAQTTSFNPYYEDNPFLVKARLDTKTQTPNVLA